MTTHGLCIDRVDHDEVGYHVRFGCMCGDYSAEETAPSEADVLTLARNDVRIHEATVTGARVVHIQF